jgi:hypothetical protein
MGQKHTRFYVWTLLLSSDIHSAISPSPTQNPRDKWYICSSISTCIYPPNFVHSNHARSESKTISQLQHSFLPSDFTVRLSMHCLLPFHTLSYLPPYSFPFSLRLPTQASSFTFQPLILFNSSSMQCRSIPSFAPPSSCYPIPHSHIAIPPCIPCITSTNFSQKEDKIRRSHKWRRRLD